MNASNNQVSTFNFNTNAIRVVLIDGNPWFIAKEICTTLDMPLNNGGATRYLQRLDPSEKQVVTRSMSLEIFEGDVKAPSLILIAESGIYKLIMRSDKPEAKPFQDWVTKVVLPAIRKDGMYVQGEEKVATGEMSEDELVLKAVSILQDKVARLVKEREPTLFRCLPDGALGVSFEVNREVKAKSPNSLTY